MDHHDSWCSGRSSTAGVIAIEVIVATIILVDNSEDHRFRLPGSMYRTDAIVEAMKLISCACDCHHYRC